MTLPVSGQSPISLSYQKSSSAWWIANWWTSWNLINSFPGSSLGSAPDIQPKPQCLRSCQTYCQLRTAEWCHCWVYSTCPPLLTRWTTIYYSTEWNPRLASAEQLCRGFACSCKVEHNRCAQEGRRPMSSQSLPAFLKEVSSGLSSSSSTQQIYHWSRRSSTSTFIATLTTVSCISTKERSWHQPWWRTFLRVSPRSRDGWHRTGWSWIPTKPSSSGWVRGSSSPRWIPVQLFLARPRWNANQPSTTLESPSTASWQWRTMFVVLALPASTSFVSCVSCVDHFHPMHVHHLYMHSSQAGWITATACSQASQTLSFGSYSQCCVSLPDSLREDGSTIRSQKSSATSFTGCLFDNESTSSWVFWSTSACTTWLLLTWWRWYYPSHTFPDGVCFVHQPTEMLSCRGQRVFGWVLEVSRALDPHSGTVFQLTWMLQT